MYNNAWWSCGCNLWESLVCCPFLWRKQLLCWNNFPIIHSFSLCCSDLLHPTTHFWWLLLLWNRPSFWSNSCRALVVFWWYFCLFLAYFGPILALSGSYIIKSYLSRILVLFCIDSKFVFFFIWNNFPYFTFCCFESSRKIHFW